MLCYIGGLLIEFLLGVCLCASCEEPPTAWRCCVGLPRASCLLLACWRAVMFSYVSRFSSAELVLVVSSSRLVVLPPPPNLSG